MAQPSFEKKYILPRGYPLVLDHVWAVRGRNTCQHFLQNQNETKSRTKHMDRNRQFRGGLNFGLVARFTLSLCFGLFPGFGIIAAAFFYPFCTMVLSQGWFLASRDPSAPSFGTQGEISLRLTWLLVLVQVAHRPALSTHCSLAVEAQAGSPHHRTKPLTAPHECSSRN